MRLINWSRKTGYWRGWRGRCVNNRHVTEECFSPVVLNEASVFSSSSHELVISPLFQHSCVWGLWLPSFSKWDTWQMTQIKAGFNAQIWACYQLNKCPPPASHTKMSLKSLCQTLIGLHYIQVQCRCLYLILWVESTDGGNEEVLPLCLQGGEAGCQQGDQQQTGEQQSWSSEKAPGKSGEVSAGGAEGGTLCVKNASICIWMIFAPFLKLWTTSVDMALTDISSVALCCTSWPLHSSFSPPDKRTVREILGRAGQVDPSVYGEHGAGVRAVAAVWRQTHPFFQRAAAGGETAPGSLNQSQVRYKPT